MDAYISLSNVIQSEHYQYPRHRKNPYERPMQPPHPSKQSIMIISLFIGVISFYLSWSRNTMLGEGFGYKLFYAFFAAMFGSLYLMFYYLRHLIDEDLLKRLSLAGMEVFPRQMALQDYIMF